MRGPAEFVLREYPELRPALRYCTLTMSCLAGKEIVESVEENRRIFLTILVKNEHVKDGKWMDACRSTGLLLFLGCGAIPRQFLWKQRPVHESPELTRPYVSNSLYTLNLVDLGFIGE